MRLAGGIIAGALVAQNLAAHDGETHLDGATILRWWTIDPFVIATLLVTTILYWRGARRLSGNAALRGWEISAFVLGWLSVVVALLSPLDRLSDILFSAHMTQHELLILVAAPLLVLARPIVPMLRGLPDRHRARVQQSMRRPGVSGTWRAATNPMLVLVLHAAVLWAWHIPGLFEAALRSEVVHAVQHLMFFGTAVLFWWALIHGRYGRMGYGISVLFVFATAMHSGLLGVLLTTGRVVWYPLYEARAAEWGVSPLEDQQLAGLIMWVPAGVLFMLLGLGLFAAWLGALEKRSERLADVYAGREEQ